VPALVAEVPEEAHAVVVHERDVGADNGFAIGELNDFDQNFLGGEPSSDDECRSYDECPQMHESSELE